MDILVGAYAVGTDRPGFGRVFEEGAGLDWTETLSFEASDGAANDQFGASVALGDDYVVVGSSNGGAAYVFGGGAYVSGRGRPLRPRRGGAPRRRRGGALGTLLIQRETWHGRAFKISLLGKTRRPRKTRCRCSHAATRFAEADFE